MKLGYYASDKLSLSKTNMRYSRTAPDVSDILPSIRARGVIVPLIVRPIEGGADDEAEIVAGYRRWTADAAARGEGIDHGPLPCAILEPGDDAAAVEASLLENIARLDPDEVNQWETFTRLVKEGRSVEDIGATFGLTDLYVRRILALGNLAPRIRTLYRAGKIDTRTVRHLTLATKAQQKDWLALCDDPEAYAPTGSDLKAWLFGGADIATKVALFPLDGYGGRIVGDLFGEHGYFADAARFWEAQNAAIAARIDTYKAAGWADVEVLEPGKYFYSYEHEKTPKAGGGKVFVTVRHDGSVEFHEGWLTAKEAKKARAEAAKAGASDADRKAADAGKPETTSGLQRYLDLHRHAAVRAVLLDHPGTALRLMLAHAITGSMLWTVRIADQRAGNAATDESVETCAGEAIFDARRREVLALLGFSREAPTVADAHDTAAVFARLLALDDAAILAVAAVVMGETLAVTSPVVDLLGAHLRVDMAALWQADDAFFAGLRDRKIVNAMLREVAGKPVADANLTEKVATQKAIIRDCLAGANNRRKVDGWVPKWLAFPPAAYAGRPLPTLDRWRVVQKLAKALPAPEPAAPPADPAPDQAIGLAANDPDYAVAAE
ncbi:ParB/RepB/Spo0J family partition protein [Sphingomonas adhaesiva]|uniref:ParB/RepB/Spo0J family partition protein n=1 Tax=Sphingomonas adhaesiva TaxID=28212 RepID=UPI002FFD35F4